MDCSKGWVSLKTETRRRGWIALCAVILLGVSGPSPSRAVSWDWATGPSIYDEEGKRDWQIRVSPYLWLSNLNGTVGLPPTGTIPVSSTFSDLSSALDSGFAGLLDVRYRRWRLLSDNSWVKLKQRITPEIPFNAIADVEASVAFGTAAVSYELPLDWSSSIEVYLGGRWWHITNDALLAVDGFGAVGGGLTETWGDAVVGARISQAITEKWRVTLLGDIGGGAARLDWQVLGMVGYMFNPYFGMSAGYRVLGVDYSNKGFRYDMRQNGLVLGVNFAY